MQNRNCSCWRMRRASSLIMAALMWAVCARGESVGFFYALDADLRTLKEAGREFAAPVMVGSRRIYRLAVGPHTVYAAKMGAGAVETAITAQALLGRFRCDWVLSVGPAGALNPELELGRWYRVSRVVPWQRGENAGTGPLEGGGWNIEWAKFPGGGAGLFRDSPEITIASGEAFIKSAGERERLRGSCGADAVDMNSYGLIAVCADHGVPLFIWKIISDRADEDAPVQFATFVRAYDGAGGRMAAECITHFPIHPANPEAYPAIKELLESP